MEIKKEEERDLLPYPNHGEDPEPITEASNKKGKETNFKELKEGWKLMLRPI